jgi:hypothetical protein
VIIQLGGIGFSVILRKLTAGIVDDFMANGFRFVPVQNGETGLKSEEIKTVRTT